MFSVSAMAAQTKQPNGGYLPVSLYKSKRVNSSYGSMDIDVPQDRKSTFEPQIVKKRQKDISDIDQKIISMYAKGMTTRQISETIEDIYGFETSEGFISDVTDKIMPQIEDWLPTSFLASTQKGKKRFFQSLSVIMKDQNTGCPS